MPNNEGGGGGELFRTWEIPRSGSKAKNGEKKDEKKNDSMVMFSV